MRAYTEQDCQVQRGSKELKLALGEAAELWEGSKTKRKRQQETAVKADIEPPAKKSKRKTVTATRPGELVIVHWYGEYWPAISKGPSDDPEEPGTVVRNWVTLPVLSAE